MWSHTQWSTFTHLFSCRFNGAIVCHVYTILSPNPLHNCTFILPPPLALPLTISPSSLSLLPLTPPPFFFLTHRHSRFPPSTGTTMIALHSFQGATPYFLMATCPSSLGWPRDWRFIWTTLWDGWSSWATGEWVWPTPKANSGLLIG